MRTHPSIRLWIGGALLSGACATDPVYVQPSEAVEVGIGDPVVGEATVQVILPVALETAEDAADRAALAAELGVDVPYVKLDDLSVSIEYTIKNLSDAAGEARIKLTGGNELFYYAPAAFIIDPEEDELPPPLAGDIPIAMEPGATSSGTLREDAVYEASIDLELITRTDLNPFAAVLQRQEDIVDMTTMDGVVIPREAFAHMVQFDFALAATTHMVMEYDVRVRDHRGILHDELLDAAEGELTAFAPTEYVPPPPPPE